MLSDKQWRIWHLSLLFNIKNVLVYNNNKHLFLTLKAINPLSLNWKLRKQKFRIFVARDDHAI